MVSAYNVKVERHTHQLVSYAYIHYKVIVLEYILSSEVYVLFEHCLPLKEVLAVCFPEGTRRRRTGTGGMVVREGTGGGMSSTVRKEGSSKL